MACFLGAEVSRSGGRRSKSDACDRGQLKESAHCWYGTC